MKKLYIVKENQDFTRIIKAQKFHKNQSFIIYEQNNNLPYDRFGISVSKKLGNAVYRNKYKRKIRSIIDNYKKSYNNMKDYIIIFRKGGENKTFFELEQDFNSLMLQYHLKNKSNHNTKTPQKERKIKWQSIKTK